MPSSVPWSQLVAAYAEWLRSKITFVELEHACEITTPFLDRHNDYLQIYGKPDGEELVLTDDGNTIRDLELAGCDVRTGRRKDVLETVLRGFGVELKGDEIQTRANALSFPPRKHAIVQAILAVNDMFMTARAHVVSLFLEDVERFLVSNRVRFVKNVQLIGKSGFHHNFDFVIPPSDNTPERILRVINNPDRNSATAYLFAWNDTREARTQGAKAYAFLNDQVRPLATEVVSALREYGSTPIPWSRRETYVRELAA